MEASMESMMKKSSESRTDLNKLQEMLGPLGGNPGDAKVNYFILITKSLMLKDYIFASICWRVIVFYRLLTKLKENYNLFNANDMESIMQVILKGQF